MARRFYDWAMRMSGHRHAVWYLAAISFAESSFFPVPPDVMLIPMILKNRAAAWWYAFVCTASSIVGGIGGYYIGYGLFETVGRPLLNLYGGMEHFAHAQATYLEWGAWIVALKGLTPIPYKIVTIASGVVKMNLLTFVLASVAARLPRFFVTAWLLRRYGAPIQDFIEKRLYLSMLILLAIVVFGIVVVEWLI
ncbi:MAG: DedA family protein [Alphaproteobacteria bacterium]|nr:DedA family protein [Alphaproteobacteria bacterium]